MATKWSSITFSISIPTFDLFQLDVFPFPIQVQLVLVVSDVSLVFLLLTQVFQDQQICVQDLELFLQVVWIKVKAGPVSSNK